MALRGARVRRAGLWLLALATTGTVAFLAWERLTFDRAGWIADYEQLRAHVSTHYANLLWVIRERQVDPVALNASVLRQLQEASTDREARAAIASFVDPFHDGHYRLHRVKLSKRLEAWWANLGRDEHGDQGPSSLSADTSAEEACTALGFHEDSGGLRFGLLEDPAFRALEDPENAFSAGVIDLQGSKLGIVRIPIFDEQRYRAVCLRTWRRHRDQLKGSCNQECLDDFAYVAVPNQLLADLSARARALKERRVDWLVVDITRNGGGTDWVDPATRLFTRQDLVCPRLSFIRGPHWAGRLEEKLKEVEEDLRADRSPTDAALLKEARGRLQRLAHQAGLPCDLGSIWTRPSPPTCSNLVEGEHYACGLFGHLPAGSLQGARTRTTLFNGLGYAYEQGVYDGRLAVLIDGWTASASEHFAAMLADHKAAVLVGQRTHGSGCGFTNGGVPAILRHSGLRIDMPDCQRSRRDGTNELAGIAPDVPVDWTRDEDDASRRAKLFQALRRLR